jgi:hypothetical protein
MTAGLFPGTCPSVALQRASLVLALLAAAILPLVQLPQLAALPATARAVPLPPLPLAFAPLADPSGSAQRFQALGAAGAITFSPGQVELALPVDPAGPAVRLEFLQASASAVPAGVEPTGGQLNLLQGTDAAAWRTGVPLYGALAYSALYPGVDLRYEGPAGQLKGTYFLAPGADPAAIRWRYVGLDQLRLDPATGDLHLQLPGGASLVERAPVAWQEGDGQRVPVPASFVLRGSEVSFQLGSYDPALPLVIDPVLVFATFAGGASGDYARDVAVDAQGNLYVVGDTLSSNFLGLTYTPRGSNDVVVLKLNPAGTSLVYAAVIGGNNTDTGTAIGLNAAGEAYAIAHATSTNFPISNALNPSRIAGNSGVLLKFAANGALAYSTWLPLNFNHNARQALAVDSQGNVLITGEHYDNQDFRSDLAVIKINAQGNNQLWGLVWSDDRVADTGNAVAVGPNDSVYVAGSASGPYDDFQVSANALQSLCGRQRALGAGYNCDQDAVVVILSASGGEQYVSYWGGDGDDHATGIAVAPDGSFAVSGDTFAADFPTTPGSLMPDCQVSPSSSACYYDTFLTKFTPGAAGVAWSTFLASDDADSMDFSAGVVADAAGNLYVAGYTSGMAFPTLQPVQANLKMGGYCSGGFTRFCFDAYASIFSPSGALSFSTYLGGELDEYTYGLAVGGNGALYLVGYTDSKLSFPSTTGALQPAARLGNEFFVAHLGAQPPGGTNPPQSYKLYLPGLIR